ncbi:MAG: hypothetical protein E7451_06295 [Ruminococcaceae bacterium]|nr:hypothetical protein [Oscillospiraceae bacterium]
MDWEQRCIRLCGAMIAAAIALRLLAGGALAGVGQALTQPGTASFLLYLQTGRVVRTVPQESAQPQPIRETVPPQPEKPAFTAEDAELITIDLGCDRDPDVEMLLTEPLELDLTGTEPKVLILHSHTTESYAQSGDRYEETSPYRTLDPGHNMLALGEIVADILEEAGIGVIHDTTFHDYPSYNGAYSHAASSTKAILSQYSSIELILDLHRDAADTPTGQLVTKCALGGETAAQLMFVMGTDVRLNHPDWERNLSLALKLQVLLEKENPGICRDLNLTRNRYNQHLGDLALLVEIGAAGNTLEQAKLAARELGEAIVKLAGEQ